MRFTRIKKIMLSLAGFAAMRFGGRLFKSSPDFPEDAGQADGGNFGKAPDHGKNDEPGFLTNTFRHLLSGKKGHIGSLNSRVFIDELTSVSNKGGYDIYIRDMQDRMDVSKEKLEFAVAVFDCDNLKSINENYGHEKGDLYLKTASRLICRIFAMSPVFRIGGDEFSVILQDEDFKKRKELLSLFAKEEKMMREASENPWEKTGITFGLAVYDPKNDTSVNDVVRRADQMMYENKRLRKEGESTPSVEELARGIKISKYVVDNVDRAVKNKWIRVYYQPVIRSLTGTMCGMESLARWDDPEVGFILPYQFIEPLEKNRQIYKVDKYVVEQVCADLHDRMLAGKPVVPVSINFSRLDFYLCNMLEVVEQAVKRYEIPREYIHIEVTESMIASDEALMRRVIDDFKKAGYEVWMDDFGSGYSSLTFLKDYSFDLLKMDMNFLTSFTDRAKKVLRSVVLMAKELGIKTLAEGVETKEELEYLKEIGCGKVQGYYYGKPQPIEEMFAHLEETQVPVETREQARFYETACEQVKPTDVPLEIVEDDGENFKTLFMNKAYMEQIFNDYPDLLEADRRIYHTPSPLLKKYREFANKMEKSGKEETFYYTGASSYLRLQAQLIAEHDGRYLMKGSLINLTMEQEKEKIKEFDLRLRELNQMFEVIYMIDLGNDCLSPLFGKYEFLSDHGSEDPGLKGQLGMITERIIRSDEKEAFAAFVEYGSLVERVGKSERGYISSVFHVLQEDGSYKPEEIVLMPIPGSRSREFLFCTKFLPELNGSKICTG